MTLIYDFSSGFIVDDVSGEVVGIIYDYDAPHLLMLYKNDRRYRRIPLDLYKRHWNFIKRYEKLMNKYRMLRRKYRKQIESGFEVDFDKLMSDRHVRAINSPRSVKAIEAFKEMGILDRLEEIARMLDDIGITSGLSNRARLVAAYVVYRGGNVEFSEVMNVISEGTWSRVMNRVRKVLEDGKA